MSSPTFVFSVLGAAIALICFMILYLKRPKIAPAVPVHNTNSHVRKIHQIWFQGQHNLPEKFQRFRKTCQTAHSDWDMYVHDDSDLRRACALVDTHDPSIGLGKLYDTAETMHEKIDMGRMAQLWVHGGVSIDMDMICTSSLERVLRCTPYDNVGLSALRVGPLATLFYAVEIGKVGEPVISTNNAVWIFPKPRNEHLLQILRDMAQGARDSYVKNPKLNKPKRIESTWGPMALTKTLCANRDRVTLFEQPFLEKTAFDESLCSDTTLCHVNQFSWLEGWRKVLVDNGRPFLKVYMENPCVMEAIISSTLGGLIGFVLACSRN